jgi:RimJ/RimL family protein N-acetyltransferase
MVDPAFPMRTERLLLRFFTDDDLDAFHDIQSREEVVRYLYWGPRSREQVRDMLERVKKLTSFDAEGHAIRVAAVLPESGALIGDISLNQVSREHAQGEIGFVIHPDHQGLGYATEACAALMNLGFGELGLHRVFGRADARNVGSGRVMERLGMRREAHLRENEMIKGEWTDEVVYAILASEWPARPAVPAGDRHD